MVMKLTDVTEEDNIKNGGIKKVKGGGWDGDGALEAAPPSRIPEE